MNFLDGYAGAGQYEDGEPGSPTLAAETADRLSEFRTLRCFYVEKDQKTFLRLQEQLSRVGHQATMFQGDVEDLWGAKTRFPTLGGTVVLVNQPTEDVAAFQSKRTAALRRVAT